MKTAKTQNKREVFQSVDEAAERYFPKYVRTRRLSREEPVSIGEQLSAELAKRFRQNLEARGAGRGVRR